MVDGPRDREERLAQGVVDPVIGGAAQAEPLAGNNQFDARGFFLPPEQPKNKLRRNQYGVVASGPIRRDRTFWLFNWEARRERRGTPNSTSVPTLAMRNGDFSELLQPGNRWYPGDKTPRTIGYPGNSAPFPNNIIPVSRFDPVAAKILATLPKPTDPSQLVNNYRTTLPFQKIQPLPSLKTQISLRPRKPSSECSI